MKEWKTLSHSRRAFYLAVVILPLVGIVLHLAAGGFSLAYLIPVTLCFLLGSWNLLLVGRGHLPRKLQGLWHLLLAFSLLIVGYLLWMMIGLIIWISSAH